MESQALETKYQINTYNCVCCHNCATECPMQAINYVGTKYQIDLDKCVGCGLCEKVCHTCSIHDENAPRVVALHEKEHRDADVVVVGGGSGIVAAVRAAQMGKKVVLIEKAEKLGGNTDYAHLFFPVYTKWHGDAGMPDRREDAVRHYQEITEGVLGEDIFRTAIYGCSDFFDWLCEFGTASEVFHLVNVGDVDSHGPIFGPGMLDFPNRIRDNLNCRDDAIGPGWAGTYVKYTMLAAIEDQGLDVEILLATEGKHLLTDNAGAICGILAEDPGGEVEIKAPVVILATGGFGSSDEKLQHYFGFFDDQDTAVTPHRFSVPTDTGDAIDMLQELGVEPDPERMFMSRFGPKHHPFNNSIADIALEPEMLQINLNGERWTDESINMMLLEGDLEKQPRKIAYAVGSRELIKLIADRFVANPAFASKRNLYATWEEDLEAESLLEIPVKKADTLEGLAALCGMPGKALVETIREYNAFCAAGEDKKFLKGSKYLLPIDMEQGPYYAIYQQRFSEASMGGLMVDSQCRVLRNDKSHIPGLYGIGDATSAMHRKGKLAVISELTWVFASAYVSSGHAVSYLDGGKGAI